jgi:predicted dehydrogenase
VSETGGTAAPTLGVGVLGYGFMGKTHTFAHRTIPFYYVPPPARCVLRAVCTSRESTARAAMQAGGFERCTTNPLEVIEADDIDVVHVCTPNSEHFAALAAAIRANKHIYCDKPVTGSLDEAGRLAAMLPGYRGAAQVALQYRFFPATMRARQLVEEGFLGPVTHFRAVYLHSGSVDPSRPVNWKSTARAGGGVIRDLGSHIVDLLWWLIGPFESVSCMSRIWAPRRPSLDEPGKMVTVDVEEAAVLMLRAADGAFGTVDVSKIATGAEDELAFEIHGRHGAMRFNLDQPNYLEVYDGRMPDGDFGGRRGWQRLATVQRYPGAGGKFPSPRAAIGWLRGHVHCLYSFLQCVADGTEPHPSLAEGLRLQRVLEAAREAAESGGWVDLPAQG